MTYAANVALRTMPAGVLHACSVAATLLLSLSHPTAAFAQVFKCVNNGQIAYQQTPCGNAPSQAEVDTSDSASGVSLAPGRAGSAYRPQATTKGSFRSSAGSGAPPPAAAGRFAPPVSPVPSKAAAAGPSALSSGCRFPWSRQPGAVAVYAVTPGPLKPAGFPIDESGVQARVQTVDVNSPHMPVALMLGSTASTIWHIRWTEGTKIIAAWASSSERSAIVGLPKSTPSLVTKKGDQSRCPSFAWYLKRFDLADELAVDAFGRRVTAAFSLAYKQSWVGLPPPLSAKWIDSPDVPLRAVENVDGWRNGEMGVVALVRDGYLRKAKRAEVWAFEDAWMARNDVPPIDKDSRRDGLSADQVLGNTYVVQKPIAKIPSGLCGAYLITLVVPKGMSVPGGDLCHSEVFDWNTMTCCGKSDVGRCMNDRMPRMKCVAP